MDKLIVFGGIAVAAAVALSGGIFTVTTFNTATTYTVHNRFTGRTFVCAADKCVQVRFFRRVKQPQPQQQQ